MIVHLYTLFGIVSGILALVAAIVYIRSILKGETKPERGAYIIWAITSTISFLAYWADGAQDSVWFAAGDFIVGIIMLGLALKYGYEWNFKRHAAAFVAVAVGLVLWVLTDEPFLALLCSVGVDAVGSILVAVKAYEAPETEHLGSWLIYLTGALLALLAVGSWHAAQLFYPAYAALATLAVVGAIVAGRAVRR